VECGGSGYENELRRDSVSWVKFALPLALLLTHLQAAPNEPHYFFTCDVPLPTAAEVGSYVQTNWADFQDRLSPDWTTASQQWELVQVQGVRCAYVYSTPHCEFVLTARHPSGELTSSLIETSFARNQHGQLASEVVVTGPDPACGRLTH
jgi:hypothetical protein